MKSVIALILAAQLIGCSSDSPTEPRKDAEPTPSTNFRYEAEGAYKANGTLDGCVGEGLILDFALDLETLQATYGVAEPSDICPDAMYCMVRGERTVDLTQTQTDELLELVNAVPDPQCVTDNLRTCDFCFTESWSLNGQNISTGCCGDTAPTFDERFAAVVVYLNAIVYPENVETPLPPGRAFGNPTTFETLSYDTGGIWGYCVTEGQVLRATITRTEVDQTLSFSGTEAAIGDAATDECIEGNTWDDNCYVRVAFGPVLLSPAQQTELEAAVAAMPAPTCVEDPGIACDPCLLHSVEVDRRYVDDACCGTMTPEYIEGIGAFIQFIEAAHR